MTELEEPQVQFQETNLDDDDYGTDENKVIDEIFDLEVFWSVGDDTDHLQGEQKQRHHEYDDLQRYYLF